MAKVKSLPREPRKPPTLHIVLKPLDSLILNIRSQKVILDADLAEIYGVPTRALNQALKRNADRFPPDFAFQLKPKDIIALRSQFVTSNTQAPQNQYDGALRSQFVTAKRGRGGRRTAPYAFTEHGALMAANVLSSAQAIKMSMYVVRAFVQQRALLMSHAEVLKKLAQIDAKLLKHDEVLRLIWNDLQPLLTPPPEPSKRRIGFHE